MVAMFPVPALSPDPPPARGPTTAFRSAGRVRDRHIQPAGTALVVDKYLPIRYMLWVYFLLISSRVQAPRHLSQKMKFFDIRLLFLCGFLLAFHPGLPLAIAEESPEIKDIIITTSDSDLLLFATVKNGFTQKMLNDVRNGVPVVFTFHMELIKTDGKWFNTTLVESAATHTLSYDAASSTYKVVLSYQDGKVVTTADLDHAKQLMAEFNGVKVIALTQLVPDAPYAIRFKVTLKEGSLPFGVHRLLPITALWDFETDWRTIEFRY